MNEEETSLLSSPPSDVFMAEEGYSLLQKSLFLAVILGAVAVYVRLYARRRAAGERTGKSVV